MCYTMGTRKTRKIVGVCIIHEQGGGQPRGYMVSTKKSSAPIFYVLGYIPRLGYIALRLGIKVSTQLHHSEAI
jgi:hypothetical protein